MSEKFYCDNKECKKGFYFNVPDEIMIDASNMAVLFCPYCSGRLIGSGLPTNLGRYNIVEDKIPNNDF